MGLVDLFSKHGVGIIFFSGIIVFIFLFIIGVILLSNKENIKKSVTPKLSRSTSGSRMSTIGGSVLDKTDREAVREAEEKFNEICAWHNVLSNIISIFPLLGILGTVSGLILQVKTEDISGMLNSLDTALGTTFWGLIFAVILKLIDLLFPSLIIDKSNNLIDNYYMEFENAQLNLKDSPTQNEDMS